MGPSQRSSLSGKKDPEPVMNENTLGIGEITIKPLREGESLDRRVHSVHLRAGKEMA